MLDVVVKQIQVNIDHCLLCQLLPNLTVSFHTFLYALFLKLVYTLLIPTLLFCSMTLWLLSSRSQVQQVKFLEAGRQEWSSLDHWGMTDMDTPGRAKDRTICLRGFSEHHMSLPTHVRRRPGAPPNYEARIVHREKIYGGKKTQKKRKNDF